MKIKDYITENLPNLNWNILPQIFEAEGVELTEGIKAYLKETPKNTNWNVFGSVGSGGNAFKHVYINNLNEIESRSDLKTVAEVCEFITDNYVLVITELEQKIQLLPGQTPLQFHYDGSTSFICATDNLVYVGPSGDVQPSINNGVIRFNSIDDVDIGIRVAFDASNPFIFMYDDRY